MLDKFKQNVSIDRFLNDSNNFIANKSTYITSYPVFLKYFNDIPVITKHHLIIGINFTYGWMPTIFDFCSDNFEDAIDILNRTKQGVIPTIDELTILKSLFNNSLVGTSKLLHFICPEKIAIWDSRVYRYLTGDENVYNHRIGNCETFLSYLKLCEYLTQIKEYDNIHKTICDEIGYQMTKFRTAELIMYNNGKKLK